MLKLFRLNRKKTDNSRGAVSLVIVMLLLATVLAIALSVNYLTSSELKLSINTGESMAAFYAAESGTEKALDNITLGNELVAGTNCSISPSVCSPNPSAESSWTSLPGGAKYYLGNVTGCVCDGSITKIQAIGEYGSVRRSIEISF